MKIMFDSNVWQIICKPEDYPDESSINDFNKIKQGIIDGKIEPYISETVFTIEAISKKERKSHFGKKNAKIETTEKATEESINLNFTIKPEIGIDFNERLILEKYFLEAVKLNFKIVRLPRIGGMKNEDIENVLYKLKDEKLKEYHDKVFEVCQKIEDNGAGMAQIRAIGEEFDTVFFRGIKKAPETYNKKIAKAAAEWADGDSVAICIALDCNYFCTRDQAKGAGNKSVLSQNNLNWLKADYQFETIAPENLALEI